MTRQEHNHMLFFFTSSLLFLC